MRENDGSDRELKNTIESPNRLALPWRVYSPIVPADWPAQSAAMLAAEMLGADFSAVFADQRGGPRLLLAAGVGWREGIVGNYQLKLSCSSLIDCANEWPIILEDLITETRMLRSRMLMDHHVRSGLSVLIPGPQRPFGTLAVYSVAPRYFDQSNIKRLQALADVLGATMVRACAETQSARSRSAALELAHLKSAFLANTSHEIRTPLNLILGYSDLIAEHLAEIGDESQAQYVEAMQRAGRRLIGTIDGILDYSRIESGSFNLRPADLMLGPIVQQIATELEPQASAKGLVFDCVIDEPAAIVRFDRHCLESSITALLHNAIKFTERGRVALRVGRSAGDALTLTVADTGVGIEQAYLAHLGEPFSQEESSQARPYEGVGLGLALTRRYARLNAADLEIASVKGVGTTVTIRFGSHPTASAHLPTVNVPNGAGDVGAGAKILLVEDDQDTEEFMIDALGGRYSIAVAGTASEAVAQIASEAAPVALILMDLALHSEDGLAVTRRLRSIEKCAAIPVVALTAQSSTAERTRALVPEFDACLAKPIDRQALCETIAGLIVRSQI